MIDRLRIRHPVITRIGLERVHQLVVGNDLFSLPATTVEVQQAEAILRQQGAPQSDAIEQLVFGKEVGNTGV